MERKTGTNQQLGINMIANIISYSISIVVSFVLTPYLINTLGKETYSFYPIANTIVSYLSVITNAMNTMGSRFITVSLVQKKEEEAKTYFSSVFASNLLMSAIILIPMVLIVCFIEHIMDVPINSIASIKGLFALVFSATIVNVSASVFGIATFAKNRIDLRSLREIVTAILRLVLFILLYSVLPPSIIYVGVVTLVVAVVNILFQIFYTRKLLPEISINKKYISWQHTKELLLSSSWNVINSLGNMLLTGTSMVIANLLYGATAAGELSIVYTVPQFINGIITMLIGVFYPVIMHRYAEGNKEGLLREIDKAQRMVGAFACAAIVVFSVLAKDFFSLWTPGENSEYLSLLSFMTILPHMFIACFWSLTNLNVAMNKVKFPALITMGLGVLNIIVCIMLFYLFKPNLVMISIVSSALQIFFAGIFTPLYAARLLGVKGYHFYKPLIIAACCSVPTLIIASYVKKLILINNWGDFILAGVIAGGLSLVLYMCAMIGKNRLVLMLKHK